MLHQTYSFSAPRWAFIFASASLFVLGGYFYIDLPLAQMLHAEREPWVRSLFDMVERLGSSEYYLMPALLVYGYGLYRQGVGDTAPGRVSTERVLRGSLFLMLTMALGGIAVALLKAGVARARPELLIDHGIYGLGLPFVRVADYNSFPSSHTLAAFAAAAALAMLFPKARWVLMIVAVAVGTARVVNLDHYFSDVMASAVIGLAAAAFLAPLILDTRRAWPVRPPWQWFRYKA